MAEKILRMIFNGISTLHPGPPPEGSPPPERAFVLMAANRRDDRRNEWQEKIPRHSPFVYVPVSVLGPDAPPPGDSVDDEILGRCNIYFLNNARVGIDPPPMQDLRYFIDKDQDGKPKRLDERPGSDDVASERDIRWLANFREILPDNPPQLKKETTPTAANIGPDLAAVIELTGGTLKASFPCKSVQPQTFQNVKGDVVKGLERVLASEYYIDMKYPANAFTVTLLVTPLREGERATGLQGGALTLKFPESGDGMLVVRMGNDTPKEARLLTSTVRCDARALNDDGTPLLMPRDTDFDLHYDLLDVPPDQPHFLPHAASRQISVDGCKPSHT